MNVYVVTTTSKWQDDTTSYEVCGTFSSQSAAERAITGALANYVASQKEAHVCIHYMNADLCDPDIVNRIRVSDRVDDGWRERAKIEIWRQVLDGSPLLALAEQAE